MEITSIDCPKCGASVSDQVSQGKIFKCNNCGSTLVWPESKSKLILSFGIRLCPVCGIENEQIRNFCRSCGTALSKTCFVCKATFYVGDKFCPNGHNYEQEQLKLEKIKEGVTFNLNEAKSFAIKGNFEQAARILEKALDVNPEWAPKLAGSPPQMIFGKYETATGYALLVILAGKMGKEKLAIQYLKRMLELHSSYPGDRNARIVSREGKIEKEAKQIAKTMGIPWHWWED
jgi:tetratricopeptide (TPR) repeat protein